MEASASSNVACADTLTNCALRAHRGSCRRPRVARLCACSCYAFVQRELLHTPPAPPLDGVSFAPLLADAADTTCPSLDCHKEAVFWQQVRVVTSAASADGGSAAVAMGYSVRTPRWRYTLWVHYTRGGGVGATDHRPRWEREIAEELYDHASDYALHAAGNDFDADEATNLAPGPDGYVGERPAAVDDATRRELKRRIYRQYVTAATELADLERALDGGATGAGALRNWSAPLPPVDAAVPAQLLQPVTADGAKRPICACPVEST